MVSVLITSGSQSKQMSFVGFPVITPKSLSMSSVTTTGVGSLSSLVTVCAVSKARQSGEEYTASKVRLDALIPDASSCACRLPISESGKLR